MKKLTKMMLLMICSTMVLTMASCLKDDDDSYDYIGYVCGPDGGRIFIIWSWSGYHEDGSLIGVDSYYALNGVYLGAVQRDYSTGAMKSSSGSPFVLYQGTIDKS